MTAHRDRPMQAGVLRHYLLTRLDQNGDLPPAAGPLHAYDGDGGYLGCFHSPFAAHQWAHQRAAEPAAVLPVEIDDRAAGWTHQVWADHCRLLLWPPPVPIIVPHPGVTLTLVPSGERT